MTVALEAKDTTLEQILELASKGDHVQLFRNGRALATVEPALTVKFPPPTPEQVERARAGLARADERSKRLGLKFDLDEFKADVQNGRM